MIKLIKDLCELFVSLVTFFLWNVWKMKGGLVVTVISFLYTVGCARGKITIETMFPALFLTFLAASCCYVDGWDMTEAHKNYWKKKEERMIAGLKKKYGSDVYDAAMKESEDENHL